MSQSSAWFPCYVNDLLGSIRWKTMTPAQRGAYWQLICWQMQSDDGHLPVDVSTLSILADIDLSIGNGCIVEAFPIQSNGKRANERALSEWGKRAAISDTRRALGKKGNDKRYSQSRNSDSNCEQLATAIALAKHSPTTTTTTTTITGTATRTDNNVDVARQSSQVKPVTKRRVIKLADEKEWLDDIRKIYQPLGVDVDTQLAKARAWLLGPKGKGRKFTQQYFINWLSRADTTVAPESSQQASDYERKNREFIERTNRMMDEIN